ncbi:MAG: V-type ATP synthase subunit E [Ruminococcus sp.]|jgi:V/A-type H+-transporting ATPase subunit E
MTGLDKILNQIEEEASSIAQQKIKAAQVQAEAIKEEARQETERRKKEILEKAHAECRNYQEKVHSRVDFQKRNALLTAKQEIISSVIQKAYEKMCSAGDEEYFACMEQLLEKYAQPLSGEICFSARDMERMPFAFKAKIKMAAMKKGGSLKLAETEAPIEGGFILVYGGIEENCSLRAIFDEKEEQLKDNVRDFLFSQ